MLICRWKPFLAQKRQADVRLQLLGCSTTQDDYEFWYVWWNRTQSCETHETNSCILMYFAQVVSSPIRWSVSIRFSNLNQRSWSRCSGWSSGPMATYFESDLSRFSASTLYAQWYTYTTQHNIKNRTLHYITYIMSLCTCWGWLLAASGILGVMVKVVFILYKIDTLRPRVINLGSVRTQCMCVKNNLRVNWVNMTHVSHVIRIDTMSCLIPHQMH